MTAMTADELAKEVGERLATLRNKKGFTQAEVAAKANLSVSYIGMLERGDRLPHIDVLFAVSNALGVPLTYFFAVEEEADLLLKLQMLHPIAVVVEKLQLKPFDILKSARVVWAVFAPKGEKSPV